MENLQNFDNFKKEEESKKLTEAVDFEDYDDENFNGPSSEMAIDELIATFKKDIDKAISDKTERSGIYRLIRNLWIEKIQKDLK